MKLSGAVRAILLCGLGTLFDVGREVLVDRGRVLSLEMVAAGFAYLEGARRMPFAIRPGTRVAIVDILVSQLVSGNGCRKLLCRRNIELHISLRNAGHNEVSYTRRACVGSCTRKIQQGNEISQGGSDLGCRIGAVRECFSFLFFLGSIGEMTITANLTARGLTERVTRTRAIRGHHVRRVGERRVLHGSFVRFWQVWTRS